MESFETNDRMNEWTNVRKDEQTEWFWVFFCWFLFYYDMLISNIFLCVCSGNGVAFEVQTGNGTESVCCVNDWGGPKEASNNDNNNNKRMNEKK